MSTRSVVLALDGGGTKTILGLADRSGAIVTLCCAPGCNPMDNPRWLENLTRLIERAGIAWASLDTAVFGLPGYGESVEIDAEQERAIRELVPAPHRIINDVHMAHDAAFLGDPGILMLAGTGSMIWATDMAGNPLRVGGWGHHFGDEGSGYWIGREALSRLSWAIDGRLDAPRFAAEMLRGLGLDDRDPLTALMGWTYGLPHLRSSIAALARDVDALASSGDKTALDIMKRAAEHLHQAIAAARRRIGGIELPPWSQLGGVFNSVILSRVLADLEGTPPRTARLPPIGGGIWRAARLAGWAIDDKWVQRLAASLRSQPDALENPSATR
jgi:glucosamine kinase